MSKQEKPVFPPYVIKLARRARQEKQVKVEKKKEGEKK